MPQSDTFFCLSIKHFLNATSDISFEIVFDLSKTGVLVAISIPIFTSQLEKSRDAVTAANLRSAYAEAAADVLTDKPSTSGPVKKEGNNLTVTISGVKIKGTQTGGVTATDFDFPFTIASGTDFGKQPDGYSDSTGVSVKFTYTGDTSGNVTSDVPTVSIVTG